ncbi:MAG: hypothetical protein K0R55_1646 [Sporomusa sp.]|nr:hypothetical protein [Sporomusa sp.]
MSILAFRTPPGGVVINTGNSVNLGVVDVSPFSQIRVIADERFDSSSDVTITLTVTEGTELIYELAKLHLTPGSSKTFVYDVPGTKLTVYANATGCGSAGIDVLIYGN